MEKPLLSILILSSGRVTVEMTLERLEDIKEHVKTEVVVVNTSGKAASPAVKAYADKIIWYTWDDNFANARNAGVKAATGKWLLYIDDDEFFIDAQPLIDFLLSDDGRYHWGNLTLYNFLDADLKTYDSVYVSRLIRLTGETHFDGIVHEEYSPVVGNPAIINAKIGHTGYMYCTKEEMKAHSERNIRLISKQIMLEPNNPRWWVQIVHEYCAIENHEKVRDLSKTYYGIAKAIKQDDSNRDEIQNLIGLFACFHIYAFSMLGEWKDAYFVYKKYSKDSYGLVADAQMHIMGAVIMYHKGQYILAENECKQYLRCFNKYLNAEMDYAKYMISILGQTFGVTNLGCVQKMAKKFADLNL